jgi:hypothetical protein
MIGFGLIAALGAIAAVVAGLGGLWLAFLAFMRGPDPQKTDDESAPPIIPR